MCFNLAIVTCIHRIHNRTGIYKEGLSTTRIANLLLMTGKLKGGFRRNPTQEYHRIQGISHSSASIRPQISFTENLCEIEKSEINGKWQTPGDKS